MLLLPHLVTLLGPNAFTVSFSVLLPILLFSFSAWTEVNYSVISKTEGIMLSQKEVKGLLFLKQVKVTILKISVLVDLAHRDTTEEQQVYLFTLQPNKRMMF